MWLQRRNSAQSALALASESVARVQHLEHEFAQLQARLEGEREVRIFAANITSAGQAAPMIGTAIEYFARSMRRPERRGRAGGLARARRAWRYLDGTFMPESEKEAVYLEEYERFAAGGRARAAHARRASDGTFLTDQ